ncbi:hypothetical protein ACFL4V_02040 [Candidatus Latescibacterota bacterium]
MHSTKLPKSIDKISSYLVSECETISANFSEFGYKERIKIERCLFLLIKTLCQKKIDYDLQGFSNFHRERLSSIISRHESDKTFNQIVEQIFQFKIFLQKLSSENAYVRGDSLSNLGLNRKTVFDFIGVQIKSIVNKLNSINLE